MKDSVFEECEIQYYPYLVGFVGFALSFWTTTTQFYGVQAHWIYKIKDCFTNCFTSCTNCLKCICRCCPWCKDKEKEFGEYISINILKFRYYPECAAITGTYQQIDNYISCNNEIPTYRSLHVAYNSHLLLFLEKPQELQPNIDNSSYNNVKTYRWSIALEKQKVFEDLKLKSSNKGNNNNDNNNGTKLAYLAHGYVAIDMTNKNDVVTSVTRANWKIYIQN